MTAERRGAPQKLHELFVQPILDGIVDSIEKGNYRWTAARARGVKRAVWEDWARWASAGVEPYASFWERIESAEAIACEWHVENMRKVAGGLNTVPIHDKDGNEIGVRTVGDWRPSTWWLSRKFTKDWSEKATLQQAAETAIAEEQIELSIPLLEQYLAKVGYRLLPLDTEPGRSDTEVSNDTRQASSAKKGRGAKPRT